MEREEENRIVEKAKTDPGAFGKLFERYYNPIYRYALHRTAKPEVAADIAAETFFKALNKIGAFKVTAAPFSAWLYKIAGNEINTFYRKGKYAPLSYDALTEAGTIPEIASPDNIEREFMAVQEMMENNRVFNGVKKAMSGLKPKYQEVLVLRFMEEKKIQEIAEITGKKEGTIKSLISRGLDKLKKIMEKN